MQVCEVERRACVVYKVKSMHFSGDRAKKGFLNSKNLVPKCNQSGV